MAVYGIHLVLIDESDPKAVLATKYVRVHDGQVPAGEYMMRVKAEEIFKDVNYQMTKRGEQ